MTTPKTFATLPGFPGSIYAPDKSIQLGSLLWLSEETKLPDPDEPLNAGKHIVPENIERTVERNWSFTRGVRSSGSGAIDAELPVFSPVGASIGYHRTNHPFMHIACDEVVTERFVPTKQYLLQALQHDFVQEWCRQQWFPAVYLVTGRKVASNAKVELATLKAQGGYARAYVDLSFVGSPVNVGPKVDLSTDSIRREATSIVEPFILAYQLKKLRLKRRGELKKMRGYNTWALFDDREKVYSDAAANALDELWDVEDVTDLTYFDESASPQADRSD